MSVISPVDAATIDREIPDDRLEIVVTGELEARCSCWWTATPFLDGERVGVIGHYAAATADAGTSLLELACERLAAHGVRRVVGPMDGSTWRRYRFVIDRGVEPPFFLEPDNPDEWPGHWTRAGFDTLATYTSAVNDSPEINDRRTDEAMERLAAEAIRIRPLDMAIAETELRRIFDLSLVAFAGNFLYTPITEAEFLSQYRAVLPFVRPELVLVAEKEDALAGYMFALPDMLQAKRGVPIDTVVLKTLAVHPSARGAGLGGALLDLAQRAAHQLGYRRVVHALIHESNLSGRISGRYARTIRRYALFGRTIGA